MKKLLFAVLSLLLMGITIGYSQVRFVCIGNSISHGKYSSGISHGTSIGDSLREMSYRFWFWEKVDSAGINATMVGYHTKYFDQWANTVVSTSRYTGHTFVNNHEAYYGITSSQFLNGGWNGDGLNCPSFATRLTGYMPDVALIHIGTNDAEATADDVLASENNIKNIIAALRARNPNITVLLARLMTDWKKISKEMPRIAQETTTSNSIVYCVDMATGFINDPNASGTMTFDWVHPNAKGQKFMAQRFFDAYMKVTKTDASAPSAPTGLTVSNIKSSSVDLSWNAATDNTGVNVYNIYANDVLVASTGKLSCTVTGLQPNTAYVFKVTAVDYKKNESAKSTGVNATTLAGASITFSVKDGSTALKDAEVTYGGDKQLTDASGNTVFPVKAGNIAYQVFKKGYKQVTGSISASKDTTLSITLLPDCMVSFVITDGTNPLQGVTVYFNGVNKTTDSQGKTSFSELRPGNYTYMIRMTGYNDVAKSVNIADDTTLTISLTAKTTALAIKQNNIEIYPNPAGEQIWIENAAGATIEILDLSGTVRLNVCISSLLQKIETLCLPEGTYVVRIMLNGQTTTSLIQIRK
mgnify:CR=1 FL=1